MKRITIICLIFMFMLAAPMAAMAASCCPTEKHGKEDVAMSHESSSHKGHATEGHGDMASDDQGKHKGHDMHMEHAKEESHDMHGGGFVTIGEKSEKNVKAVAKVMAYDEQKAAMINATHHIMVFFSDAESGAPITSGKVALKVKGHDGSSKPMMLMQMGEGFGADLRIEKGHYDFEVGSKLQDGKKRQFEYPYMAN